MSSNRDLHMSTYFFPKFFVRRKKIQTQDDVNFIMK